MSGTLYPEWAVGFAKPFTERIGCRFESDTIAEVTGQSGDTAILRDMLVGGRLIELGCGFNPKARATPFTLRAQIRLALCTLASIWPNPAIIFCALCRSGKSRRRTWIWCVWTAP